MKKGTTVIFIDPAGVEHDALVFAENGMNPGLLSVLFIDMSAPDQDNAKRVYDIPHFSDSSKDEINPELPRYAVNCYKEYGEAHLVPPADHPMFDHAFKSADVAQNGERIPVSRPLTEAAEADHLASAPVQEASGHENDLVERIERLDSGVAGSSVE
jgi:hypothetical protein